MNSSKITFIYIYNKPHLLERSLSYVNDLLVPEDMEVEIIKLNNQRSMCSGYNNAMKMTDARYKVYLHQDVNILNRNFIYDLVSLFIKDSKIGVIGMCGPKRLPSRAVWWEAPTKYGQIVGLKFQEPIGPYEYVDAVDGLLIATQYDVQWREDLFRSWHMYDISQCKEFRLKGYKVAVPRQSIGPWVEHDQREATGSPGYDLDRELYINYYRNT